MILRIKNQVKMYVTLYLGGIIIYAIILIIMVLFSLFVLVFSVNLLHLMLIWNLCLALFPFLFIKLYKENENKYKKGLFLFFWIIFLPNSYYLITDLIHIQFIEFKQIISPYEMSYSYSIISWLQLINILVYAIAGITIGCANVDIMSKLCRNKKEKIFYHIGIATLCSMAIYIGRFLRFNSWDIFNFPEIVSIIIDSISPFTFSFIIIFALLILCFNMVYCIIVKKGN